MNRFIDVIGVRTVVENLDKYLQDTAKADAATQRLAKAQLALQQATLAGERQRTLAANRVTAAETALSRARQDAIKNNLAAVKNVGIVERAEALRIQKQAEKVSDARDAVADAVDKSARQQEKADIRLTRELRNQDALKIASSERVAKAYLNEINVAKAGAAAFADKRIALTGAKTGVVDTGATTALALERAQIGAAAAGVKLTASQLTANLATRLFAAGSNIASQAVTQLGRIMVAVTGFANRFAVSMRFGVAAVLAFAAAIAVNVAADFETQFVKINNLTNLTTQQTEELRAKVLELTKTMPQSPAELGAGAYFILSSGIRDLAQAEDILTLSAQASAIGLGTVDEVARTVTAVVNAYGKANINAAQATDILVAGVKEGSAEAAQFATDIGRLLGIAPVLGVKFDELVASVAALTNVGLSSSQATTALLGIMNQLFSPAQGARDMLIQIGTSIEQVRTNIREKGLIVALKELLDLFGGNQQALEKLFPEVRGLTGALDLLRNSGDDLAKTQANVSKSVGITESAFKKVEKTFNFQAGLLKNVLNRVLIDIGTKALPTLTNALRSTSKWINENREEISTLVTTGIQIAVASIKIFINIILAAAKALIFIYKVFSAIKGAAVSAANAISSIGNSFAWTTPLIKKLGIIASLMSKIGAFGPLGQGGDDSGGGNFLTKSFNTILTKDPRLFTLAKVLGIKPSSGDDKKTTTAEEEDIFGEQELKDLIASFNDVELAGEDAAKGADKAAEALKQLAQDFKSTGEAANQVKSFTTELNLFGNVSKELAEAFGLTAEAAGAVQGYDAFVRATERADREAFEFSKTIATVATAFQHSARIGQQIVLGLARAALTASQTALGSVLGRPTREVADLQLNLAQLAPGRLRTEQSINPQIDALQESLDRLREMNDAQSDAISERLDALKDRDEARLKALDKRLEIEKKQLNELERVLGSWLDSINETIGFLEAAKPFARTQDETDEIDFHIAAFKADRDQINNTITAQENLVDSIENQKDNLEEANERAVEALERQQKALDKNTESQEKAIERQIEALQGQIDKYTDAEEAIQNQIDLYEAEKAIFEAIGVSADKTLLSEEDQRREAGFLIEQIGIESEAIKNLTSQLGEHLLPEVTEANRLFDILNSVISIETNGLIPSVEAAADRARILAAAAWEASEGISGLGGTSVAAMKAIQEGLRAQLRAFIDLEEQTDAAQERKLNAPLPGEGPTQFPNDSLFQNMLDLFNQGFQGNLHAAGGLFNTPHIGVVAEKGIEAVVPLTNPTRAREVIASIPPSFFSAIFGARNSSNSGGMKLNVEHMTIMDPRKDTGPVGDMAYSFSRGLKQRGLRV